MVFLSMIKCFCSFLLATHLLVTFTTIGAEVNVYSARKEALIKPVLERFTEQTGIKVNLLTGKADTLITRIEKEGKYGKADLLLTTDVGRLVRAKQAGLTQPVSSDLIEQTVKANLRDSENHWIALTVRARPIMYNPKKVSADELSTMQDLTDVKWKGRICIRSSSNIYNQSMLAAMIEQDGLQATQKWASAFTKNFARPPKGGDRDQIKAVAAGQCDIAIANTYYLAGMLVGTDKEAKKVASNVAVFWPDQESKGTHINISGAAISKYAPNLKEAKSLLDFMLSQESQEWYASTNNEYPVREGVAWSQVLLNFGQFKGQQIELSRVGELNAQAVMVMDKAGWK
jgi:iron(III) transport system substrate-binding protein